MMVANDKIKEDVKIQNAEVYLGIGMFCGTDDSDLLAAQVFKNRHDARNYVIDKILEAAFGADLIEDGNFLERAILTVYAPSLDEPNDSIRDLVRGDDRIPEDVSRIVLKNHDYDEYWEWKVEERRVI